MANTHDAERRNAEEGKHSVASLVADIKNELVEFVQTRVLLLVSELGEKQGNSKKGAVLASIALIFGSVAFLLLTLAAVGLVSVAFWGSPFAFFWGFLIIGILYALLAGLAAIAAYYILRSLLPNKTIKVLHDDKAWLQSKLPKQS